MIAMYKPRTKYKHDVVLYCWNEFCNRIIIIKLNGKERIVKCPYCHQSTVYAKPHPDNFIQNNYERVLMRNIRQDIKEEYENKLMVRKLICSIFRVR
jgi:hypothetical protein